ncbi:MAG: PH domain-containing protein [Balneolaceae bacterium]
MSEFRRLHPVAALARAGEMIRGNLLTLLAILIFGSRGEDGSFLWVFLGLLVSVLLVGLMSWWRFRFRIGRGEMEIHQGIWVRKELLLRRERVQVIDLSYGPVQRLFGLVRVDVKTAGSTSREARLSAVTKEVADEIIQELKTGRTSAREELWQEKERVRRLPMRHLLLAATTSSSFGIVLSLLATLLSQLDPFLQESEWAMQQFEQLPGTGRPLFWMGMLMLFVLFAWCLSFAGTLVRYGNFTLTKQNEGLVIRHGLFEKKQITLPYHRIQAVRVVEGILRQPFGYLSIELDSAGYGEEREAASVVMMPLLPEKELEPLVGEFLPGFSEIPLEHRSPGRALFRRIVRTAGGIGGGLALLQWGFDLSPWIWICWVPSLLWGWLVHKDAAVGCMGDRMALRTRRLARTTTWIHRDRIQQMSFHESVPQRWRWLTTISVSVASGDRGRSVRVRDMDNALIPVLRSWFRRRIREHRPSTVDYSSSSGSA